MSPRCRPAPRRAAPRRAAPPLYSAALRCGPFASLPVTIGFGRLQTFPPPPPAPQPARFNQAEHENGKLEDWWQADAGAAAAAGVDADGGAPPRFGAVSHAGEWVSAAVMHHDWKSGTTRAFREAGIVDGAYGFFFIDHPSAGACGAGPSGEACAARAAAGEGRLVMGRAMQLACAAQGGGRAMQLSCATS